jgi:ribulose-phosphate 3-epimerase
MALVAPSILAADFTRLGEALGMVKAAGAAMIHVEVMDGHFLPDITVGQPVIASLRKATDLVLDVHLQIERPERYAAEFVELGADRLCVHAEATPHLHRVLDLIRARGAKAGAALNPATPLEAITDILGDLDFLTILTADGGLQEQRFIPGMVSKLRAAAQVRAARRLDFAIQVEGGVSLENAESLARAGADILVAGSAIFSNVDPKARLGELMRLAAGTPQTFTV